MKAENRPHKRKNFGDLCLHNFL